MAKRPRSVNVNFGFMLLNTLIWLVFGAMIATNAHPALPDLPYIKAIMALMSFILAGLLLLTFLYLRRQNRIAYYFSLIFYAFISLLTIFDDFGYSDLLILAINLVPILLLIKDRTWYLPVRVPGGETSLP